MKDRSFAARLAISFQESTWSTRIIAVVLSVVFAASTVVGSLAAGDQSHDLYSAPTLFLTALKALLTSAVFYLISVPVLHQATRARGIGNGPAYRGLWAMPAGRRRLIICGALAAAWFIYWVMLWPGVTTADSYSQLLQAWGVTGYSDHHPILQTLVIQVLVEPALSITGSPEVAIGFATLVQMLALAAIMGLCIDALRLFEAPGWALTASLLFFALHPIIGWYSVTMWKDVWLGASTLAVATLIAVLLRGVRAQTSTNWRLWLLLFIAFFAMMASKKSALYIVLPTIVVVALILRRRDLLKWLAVGVGSVVVYLGVHAGVMLALQVQPGSEVEAWSMPSQQIARVVHEHGEVLSETQVRLIDEFFPDANLGELYRPGVSDPVKRALDATELGTNRPEFLALWFELGREYPATYFEAFVHQTYGYWYPGVSYWMVSDQDLDDMVEWYPVEGIGAAFLVERMPAGHVIPDGAKRAAAEFVNTQLRDVPVIGWLFSLGVWTWASVALGAVAALRRQSIAIVVVVISGMVWLSAMLSPVFAEARYVFPMLLLLPLLSVVTFLQRPNPSAEQLAPEDEVLTRA